MRIPNSEPPLFSFIPVTLWHIRFGRTANRCKQNSSVAVSIPKICVALSNPLLHFAACWVPQEPRSGGGIMKHDVTSGIHTPAPFPSLPPRNPRPASLCSLRLAPSHCLSSEVAHCAIHCIVHLCAWILLSIHFSPLDGYRMKYLKAFRRCRW